jgi:hypothetical protein
MPVFQTSKAPCADRLKRIKVIHDTKQPHIQ